MKITFLLSALMISTAHASAREAICNVIEKSNIIVTNSSCSEFIEVEKDVFTANQNICSLALTGHAIMGKTEAVKKNIEKFKTAQVSVCAIGTFSNRIFVVEKLVLPEALNVQ